MKSSSRSSKTSTVVFKSYGDHAESSRAIALVPSRANPEGPFQPIKGRKQRNGKMVAELEESQNEEFAHPEGEVAKKPLANPRESKVKGRKGQRSSSLMENEKVKGVALPTLP